LTISVDLTTAVSSSNFNIGGNFLLSTTGQNFAGVTGLSLASLDSISSSSLGIFSNSSISSTLTSLSEALNNVNKVASYLGGVSVRLTSQSDALKSQITNYNAAISRIEDADVALEQLELIKSQFLQQTSLTSLAQSNQNPQNFLQLLR
jgi:flagellin